MTEHEDPFMPSLPSYGEFGRLFSHGVLTAGWPCRWCGCLLGATPAENGLMCIHCDDAPEATR